jgi:hypothetical protein
MRSRAVQSDVAVMQTTVLIYINGVVAYRAQQNYTAHMCRKVTSLAE